MRKLLFIAVLFVSCSEDIDIDAIQTKQSNVYIFISDGIYSSGFGFSDHFRWSEKIKDRPYEYEFGPEKDTVMYGCKMIVRDYKIKTP